MTEPRISRVVVGALHQALADHLPLRLEFYEDYLRPMRLREGRVGAASFLAALSFLRREDGEWERVMMRAGHHAAEWIFDSFSGWQQALYRRVPIAWRVKHALRLVRDLISETMPDSRATFAFRRGHGRLVIHGSAFCDVRERTPAPMCRFYGATLERLSELLNVSVRLSWEGCRAMGEPSCVLMLAVTGALEPGGTTSGGVP
jgi:hypothetical protein